MVRSRFYDTTFTRPRASETELILKDKTFFQVAPGEEFFIATRHPAPSASRPVYVSRVARRAEPEYVIPESKSRRGSRPRAGR